MRSALYYPHTTIASEQLLRTALLLWDKIEYIAPWSGFRPDYRDPYMSRAAEIITKAHVPTSKEREEAHHHIEEFVTRALPEPFYYHHSGVHEEYEIYPQKLLPATWDLLREAQVAGDPLEDQDMPTSLPTGLTIMSILADCCAGDTRLRVTDRSAAYATLTGLLKTEPDDRLVAHNTTPDQLVPITLDVIDAGSIDFKRLIEFRERESKKGGHAIRDLRHRYLDRLESQVKTLTTLKANSSDITEVKRQFSQDMKDDLAFLRDELKSARNEVLFSKDFVVAAIASVGTLAALLFGVPYLVGGVLTAAGAPATIGGLLSSRNKYLSSRRSVLQTHPMAYLYELSSTKD